MSGTPPTLKLWRSFTRKPAGRWMFSKAICFRAPYFSSIRPLVQSLEPGLCVVQCQKRRAVTNHIGTFHAIAMCNMAELAGGLAAEATVPTTHRWIPQGMEVDYVAKAETDLTATCVVDLPTTWDDRQTLSTPVDITDASGQIVFRARIRMYVSKKPARKPAA